MNAEILRQAAALMRERAEAAERDYFSRGPWKATVFDDGRAWVGPARISMHGYPNTAEHIASWHPDVAALVADVLDQHAGQHGPSAGRDECLWNDHACNALALARAYLGSDQ